LRASSIGESFLVKSCESSGLELLLQPSACFVAGQASQTSESGLSLGDFAVVGVSPKICWVCSLTEAKPT